MSKVRLWHPNKQYQIIEVLPQRGTTSIPSPKRLKSPLGDVICFHLILSLILTISCNLSSNPTTMDDTSTR